MNQRQIDRYDVREEVQEGINIFIERFSDVLAETMSEYAGVGWKQWVLSEIRDAALKARP